MTQTNPSLQLTLFQAENEADRYIQYTMAEQANALARILTRKQLPMFYFTEAGEELGIPAKTCRSWKINVWPPANQHGDGRLIYKVAIYLRVYLRLNPYPEGETYAEATLRLQRRVGELKEKGYSHNQISQHLKLSFRTLKDILTKKPEEVSRRNQCPWALLEKLEEAESGMREQREREEELRENRILREGKKNEGMEPTPKPPEERMQVEEGGGCPKCGAAPNNLRYDGEDAWGRTVMACIICGNESPRAPQETRDEIREEDGGEKPNPEEFIERYDSCRSCGTAWHNMKRERVDRWRNTVYICVRCAAVSRVKPKKQRTRAA